MGQIAEYQLGKYDNDVEPDPDGERPVKVGRGMAVTMVMIVVMLLHAALEGLVAVGSGDFHSAKACPGEVESGFATANRC